MVKKYSIMGIIAAITMLSSIAFATATNGTEKPLLYAYLEHIGGPQWKLSGPHAPSCTPFDFIITWTVDSVENYESVSIESTLIRKGVLYIFLDPIEYNADMNYILKAGGQAIDADVWVMFSGFIYEVDGPEPARRLGSGGR